jgi:hypothetical protein
MSVKHPDYNVWRKMRQRCNDPKYEYYPHYGGKGVKVCARWDSFANFIADMGPRPTPKHTIDRINNDGNYDPANCRWATMAEQNRNRSLNVYLEINGERKIATDVAKEYGISTKTLRRRFRDGHRGSDLITTAKLRQERIHHQVEVAIVLNANRIQDVPDPPRFRLPVPKPAGG